MTRARHATGVQLLQGGQQYFPALVQALDHARSWVQLETYIFDLHGAGTEVANALMGAARRGVRVEVLVDGFGSDDLPLEWQSKMTDAGVSWCIYSPLAASLGGFGLLVPDRWRRLHRKLAVVDQQILFCGGINILDDFYDPNHGALQSPRFDFAVQLAGPVAREAAEAMALLWWRVQAGYSARQNHLVSAWEKFKAAGFGRRTSPGLVSTDTEVTPAVRQRAGLKAQLVLRDNLRNRNSIEKAYRQAIGGARHEVLIANAYFLPGGKLRRALIKAARRGVKVTLLLQGKYEYFMQHHAARPVYGALLAAGIEIHEYAPSFLHAKVAVIDGRWATVGSSNLDPLSMLLAREANVVLDDPAFAGELKASVCAAIAGHGRLLDAAAYSRRPWGQRMLDHIAYALMRLAIFVAGHRY
ncbi:MAG: phospholipase D/Transphosphatidylase [Polaromonas sp.]|nr:phospholipase D/Transphosphatidylase [Polaromonas sp.]